MFRQNACLRTGDEEGEVEKDGLTGLIPLATNEGEKVGWKNAFDSMQSVKSTRSSSTAAPRNAIVAQNPVCVKCVSRKDVRPKTLEMSHLERVATFFADAHAPM